MVGEQFVEVPKVPSLATARGTWATVKLLSFVHPGVPLRNLTIRANLRATRLGVAAPLQHKLARLCFEADEAW
jgi:hypothetical protein